VNVPTPDEVREAIKLIRHYTGPNGPNVLECTYDPIVCAITLADYAEAAARGNAALRERVKELEETVAKLERMHTGGICTYEHNGKGWTTQPQEGEFGSVRFYDDHIRHCAKWLSEMPGGMKRWLKEYERTNPPE
jgi:hypothetical protein